MGLLEEKANSDKCTVASFQYYSVCLCRCNFDEKCLCLGDGILIKIAHALREELNFAYLRH